MSTVAMLVDSSSPSVAVSTLSDWTATPQGAFSPNTLRAWRADFCAEEQQELLLFIGARLRAKSVSLPAPRTFGREQLNAWITDDEDGMRRFKAGE